jgi:hypothetical protein
MTDKEFIEKHILKDWVFTTDMPTTYNIGNIIFGVCSSDNSIVYPISKFIEHVNFYYGEWYCDIEGKYLSEIIREWFQNKKSQVIKEINNELLKLEVVLGSRNWECIDEHGEIFFWKKLVIKFKGKYDKKLIKSVYDEWFQDKVVEVSEKIMDSPWS